MQGVHFQALHLLFCPTVENPTLAGITLMLRRGGVGSYACFGTRLGFWGTSSPTTESLTCGSNRAADASNQTFDIKSVCPSTSSRSLSDTVNTSQPANFYHERYFLDTLHNFRYVVTIYELESRRVTYVPSNREYVRSLCTT